MRPNPYIPSSIAQYERHIEVQGNCFVTLQKLDEEDFGGGWFAWANRDSEFHPGSFRTVATADGDSPIETLDRLAAALGIETEVA